MIHIASLFLVLFVGFQQDGVSAEEFGTNFTCFHDKVRIEVNRTEVPRLTPETMHLNDESCNATYFNDTFILFETSYDSCGTMDESNYGYIIFSNIAHWDPPETGSPIVRIKGFRAKITCRFPRNGVAEEQPTVELDPAVKLLMIEPLLANNDKGRSKFLRWKLAAFAGLVVRRVDNAIHWIVNNPAESAIHPLNNWGQVLFYQLYEILTAFTFFLEEFISILQKSSQW